MVPFMPIQSVTKVPKHAEKHYIKICKSTFGLVAVQIALFTPVC